MKARKWFFKTLFSGKNKNTNTGKYGQNLTHITWRNDLSNLIPELVTVMTECQFGVAVIVNSTQESIFKKTITTDKLQPEIRRVVENYSKDKFAEVLVKAGQKKPDFCDCYKIWDHLWLPVNSLVYIIENKKKVFQIILLFKGQRVKEIFEKYLIRIEKILKDERISNPMIDAGAQDRERKWRITPIKQVHFNRLHSTQLWKKQLEIRFAYLLDKVDDGKIQWKEKVEYGQIDSFLMSKRK